MCLHVKYACKALHCPGLKNNACMLVTCRAVLSRNEQLSSTMQEHSGWSKAVQNSGDKYVSKIDKTTSKRLCTTCLNFITQLLIKAQASPIKPRIDFLHLQGNKCKS